MRIVVFASGRGSNFEAILDAIRDGELNARVVALCSDKPASRAVQLADDRNVPVFALDPKNYPDRESFDRALFGAAEKQNPDLIVLAGFMRIVDGAVIERWRGRIINIHPSLLPKYPGLHTHQRALDARDDIHGASVHFVTPKLDGGPVIACTSIDVEPDDDPAMLAARLLPREHELLIAVIALVAAHRVELCGEDVCLDGARLGKPLRIDPVR